MDTAPPIPPPHYDFSVVRHLREREGQTLEQLAEACGIPVPMISKPENDQPGAELEVLTGIAAVFGMAASNLVALAESSRVQCRQAGGYASHGFYFHRIRYPNHHRALEDTIFILLHLKNPTHFNFIKVC